MRQKKFIYWWQHWLRRTVPSIVFVAMVTFGVLSVLGITAPISYASTVYKTSVEATAPNITVYRSPECSCCGGWIEHLEKQGFKVQDFPTSDIEAVKQKLKVPNNLTSCHTAIIDKYVIEGHVPANDIKRLLQEKSNVSGLSVPNMPVGTPGMEMGNKKDPFTVFSFNDKNTVGVFTDYPSS